MSVDTLYCHRIAVEPRRAAKLQKNVAYALRHFHETSDRVTRALDNLREIFFVATSWPETERAALLPLLGVVPASAAFGVPYEEMMSPSPADTRIAFVVGRPCVTRDGKRVLRSKFFVGLRIVDRATIYLSSICKRDAMYLHAEGGPARPMLVAEGERVTLSEPCCTKMTDAMRDACVASKECLSRAAEEALSASLRAFHLFENHVTTALGITDMDVPTLKRAHSSTPTTGLKRALGA